MAQHFGPQEITVAVEGLGTFTVPVGTPDAEIVRLANEFEAKQRATPSPTGAAQVLAGGASASMRRPELAVSHDTREGPSIGDFIEKGLEGARDFPGSVADLSEWLPEAGGTVGGLLGGRAGGYSGAVAGAGLGGGSGEAFRQLLARATDRPAPSTSGEAATDIALEGLVQAALEGGGRAPGKLFGALGNRMWKSGLRETEIDRFGDLGRMVGAGSLSPEQNMKRALGLIADIRKKAPLSLSQESVRQLQGDLSAKELRALGSRAPKSVTNKARTTVLNTLDRLIKEAPPEIAEKARLAKELLGLERAEVGAIGRTPSMGAAALGTVMGAGGYMLGGVPGAVMGASVPLLVAGYPGVGRTLGKTVYRAGQGLEASIPSGLRALLQLLREDDQDDRPEGIWP